MTEGADELAALIDTHLARYPEAGIADIYKLLHQATFGPGHLIASKKAAREWLEQEIEQLTPSREEPLVESIHPEGLIVRLHLRPYLSYETRSKPLLDVLARSAEQVVGDSETMERRWRVFEALCQPGAPYAPRFETREISLFGRIRRQERWPATHHSPAYERAYRPKYRVLTRAEADALGEKINAPFEVV